MRKVAPYTSIESNTFKKTGHSGFGSKGPAPGTRKNSGNGQEPVRDLPTCIRSGQDQRPSIRWTWGTVRYHRWTWRTVRSHGWTWRTDLCFPRQRNAKASCRWRVQTSRGWQAVVQLIPSQGPDSLSTPYSINPTRMVSPLDQLSLNVGNRPGGVLRLRHGGSCEKQCNDQ